MQAYPKKGDKTDSAAIRNAREPLLEEFRAAVKREDRAGAFAIFAQIQASNLFVRTDIVVNQLWSLCKVKEDLEPALELFTQIMNQGGQLSEGAFQALIRCYMDSKDVDTALGLIKQMLDGGIEPRMRAYQPILDYLCEVGDLERAMKLVHHLWSRNVKLREEQYMALLTSWANSGAAKSKNGLELLTSLLESFADSLSALPYSMIEQLHTAFNNQTGKHQVVANIIEVQGDKLPNGELQEWTADPGHNAQYAITKRHSDKICGSCGAHVLRQGLSADETQRVRVALMKLASATTMEACKSLQKFSDWLEARPEYSIVLDGANVAYNGQPKTGENIFKFHQIVTLVETLERYGERVLVTLPYMYTQRIVKSKRVILSPNDMATIEKMQKEEKLYVVPNGVHDDWCWMYFTVGSHRTTPGLVVTNDMMRDHRMALLEPRPFERWRNAHVMSFEFVQTPHSAEHISMAKLYPPSVYSRECFFDAAKNSWHIPASDQTKWLCIQLPKK